MDNPEEQDPDRPRREPLQPARHGARVDFQDADARGAQKEARLELVRIFGAVFKGGGERRRVFRIADCIYPMLGQKLCL